MPRFLLNLLVLAAWTSSKAADEPNAMVDRAVAGLKSPDLDVRRRAARDLAALGPKAAPAVPALVAMLRDPRRSDSAVLLGEAALALGAVGPEAKESVPTLAGLLVADGRKGPAFREASWALGEFGPAAKEAVPLLLRARKAFSQGGRGDEAWIDRALVRIGAPAVPALLAEMDKREAGAAFTLAKIGAPSLPGLRERVLRDSPDDQAFTALRGMGSLAVSVLVEVMRTRLKTKNDRHLSDTARELAYLGPDAVAAVPLILEAWEKRLIDAEVAVHVLGSIGPAAKTALPALAKAADGPGPLPLHGFVVALEQIGPGDPKAATAMLLALAEWRLPCFKGVPPNVRIQARALRALAEVNPESGRTALPLLRRVVVLPSIPSPFAQTNIQKLRDDQDWAGERARLLHLLPHFGPKAVAESAPILIDLLKNERWTAVRIASTRILDDLGPDGLPAVPALIARLTDVEGGQDIEAAWVLGKLARHDAALTKRLVDGLKSEDKKHARLMLHALTKSGAGAKGAIPHLVGLLSDGDEGVRANAAEALGTMGAEAQEAVPALARLLGTGSPSREAALALGRIGPAAREAAGDLETLIGSDAEDFYRLPAAEALRAVAPARVKQLIESVPTKKGDGPARRRTVQTMAALGTVPAARPWLIEAMRDADAKVRAGAATALGRLGAEAVPALTAALDDDNAEVRRRAAVALGTVGPAAKAALPALRLVGDQPRFRRTPRGLERYDQDAVVLLQGDVETAIRRIERRQGQ